MFLYILIAVISCIIYIKLRQSYWTRRGIVQIPPGFLNGDATNILTGKLSLAQAAHEKYMFFKSLNQRGGGSYTLLEPIYWLVDPSLIKDIVQKDFDHFTDRKAYHHPKDILSMNLICLEGDVWRSLRAKLTPTFTSGKMKMMFDTLVEKADGLEKLVDEYANNDEHFAIKDVLARYTTDVIGSCAFGIECNSMGEPNNLFQKYGKKVLMPRVSRLCMTYLFPSWFLANVGYKFDGHDVTNFFSDIVKETIKARETSNIIRKDFMHLLIQLKNENKISDNEIIAQCFIFFLAGFETSSSTLTFALLELAQNPDIQKKLRHEIDDTLEKYDGQVTYDAVMAMNYLDRVIHETLRKFPVIPVFSRVCTKRYRIPSTNAVIEKGTRVLIPVFGLHRDPEYYPDPELFDPDRFNAENKAKRPDCTFLPFGGGPRMCIGIRFGMFESKVGLISLIRNFHFTLSKKTSIPIQMSRSRGILSVEGEVWVNATRLRNNQS